METERLRLRALTVDDAQLMLSVWNDPAFIRNVSDRGIRTDERAREAIRDGAQKLFERFGYGPYCMALKTGGAMIGICGLFKRESLDDPDIEFAVLPDYCGKGFAGEAAEAVIDYARNMLGVGVLTAIVSPGNVSSIGLIEKLGLEYERMITMPGENAAVCLYRMTLVD
jgi:RimJ/RimL family protein N-acetyltransferase